MAASQPPLSYTLPLQPRVRRGATTVGGRHDVGRGTRAPASARAPNPCWQNGGTLFRAGHSSLVSQGGGVGVLQPPAANATSATTAAHHGHRGARNVLSLPPTMLTAL